MSDDRKWRNMIVRCLIHAIMLVESLRAPNF